MRAKGFIAFSLIVAVWVARADEKLPVLKAGINTYSNVTVTTVTATDIYFTYAGGMGNAKLKQLSPELQKHFGYNPTKASEVEQKQAAANTQFHNQVVGKSSSQPLAGESLVQASGLTWSLDFPQALARAKAGNKMVLIDFTGSDWCPWCIKFDEDVLSTGKFAAYAESKLVLVLADFPRHTMQSSVLEQANQELKDRFRVSGFPTLVVLNSSGKEIGRQVGYSRGGSDAFIAELDGFSRK
ncbi:MAG: thioredoxin family protein [Limisphaerales bacterium]